jgi:hypothetical protein
MKNVLIALIASLSMLSYAGDTAPAEKQKVCIDKMTKDGKPVLGKDGKVLQDCKMMKIHNKLEGTKVPAK